MSGSFNYMLPCSTLQRIDTPFAIEEHVVNRIPMPMAIFFDSYLGWKIVKLANLG